MKNIAMALVKAQTELKNPDKNQQGHGYRYADLASILDQTKPVLSKNGLAISQLATDDGNGRVGVKTILLHESGEMLESNLTLPIPEMLTRDGKKMMTDTQAAGAAITYARRYAISAILNIAADEDTDAAGAQKKPSVDRTNGFSTSQPANSNGKITTKQMGYIGKLIDQSNSDRARINEAYGVASIANLTSGQASQLIDQLNKKIETLSATQQA
jgi:hypothetical protein